MKKIIKFTSGFLILTLLLSAASLTATAAAATASAPGFDGFAGKEIAVVTGVLTYNTAEKIGGIPVEYPNSESAAESLRQGRAAGFMHALSLVREMAARAGNNEFDVIAVPGEIFNAQISGFSHDPAVIGEFNEFLAAVTADGSLEEMKTRWFDENRDINAAMPGIENAGTSGENGVLTVATCSDAMPFVYKDADGEFAGFSAELALRFGAYTGKAVVFTDMDFAGLIPYIANREADLGIANLAVTEERKQMVLFTEPFYTEYHGILVLKETAPEPGITALQPAAQALTPFILDGKTIYRLRDVAFLLSGAPERFDVHWDARAGAVQIIPGKAYAPTGGELNWLPADNSPFVLNGSPVFFNGVQTELTLYNADGTNFTALEDLAALLNVNLSASLGFSSAQSIYSPDYTDKNNWLSFGGDGGMDADIFVIYPTVTQSMEDADRPYVRLDSELMRMAAAGWLMETEMVVAGAANIYAPLYRQLNGVELDGLNSDSFASYTNAAPRDDIFAAFLYYLENVNKAERPFILYGHSQGAQLALELATTFLGDEKYARHNENHIITYAVGCPVTAEQVKKNPYLAFSQSAEDTGVIVSWNTTAPSEVTSGAYTGFGTWRQNALVTNPLTWADDEIPAEAVPFAGMLAGPEGFTPVTGEANAAADRERGVLVVTTVDDQQYVSMSGKVSKFHACDILFFMESVSQNIRDRITAFTE